MARHDRRVEIIRAALQEVSVAGPEELLLFLTPTRLADDTREPDRTWSAGTVRYHFRRDGLAFDRGQLAGEIVKVALEDVAGLLTDWQTEVESRLGGVSPSDAETEFSQGMQELGAVLRSASSSLRALIVAGLVAGEAASEGVWPGEAIHVLSRTGEHLVEAYARALGVPFPGTTLACELGLTALAGALGGHLFSHGAERARTIDRVSRSLSVALCGGAEAAAGPEPPGSRGAESADEVVSRIQARLQGVDLTSAAALTMLEELASVLPTSSWAFSRGRQILEAVLDVPGIRASEAGQRVWSVAAEVVGMATGNRDLAEQAADAGGHRAFRRRGREDLLASVRRGWLLLRLERFEEARAELERVRHAARRSGLTEVSALADAFIAHGAALDGPLHMAVEAAERVSRQRHEGADAGFAPPLAGAAAGRALLLMGETAQASAWLQAPGGTGTPRSLGQTMLEISRAWMLLASGQDTEALGLLVSVRQRLERLHVTNPAGWAWLEPSIVALRRLGRMAQAQQLLERASPHADRWGTPVVLAEVLRARAHIAASARERDQRLGQALDVLETTPGRIERDRTQMMLELTVGGVSTESDVHPESVLVQVGVEGLIGLRMTPRVRSVAELVAKGLRNQDIADILHLTPATVSQHVSAAMRATGTSTRTELALVMTRRSQTSPEPGS